MFCLRSNLILPSRLDGCADLPVYRCWHIGITHFCTFFHLSHNSRSLLLSLSFLCLSMFSQSIKPLTGVNISILFRTRVPRKQRQLQNPAPAVTLRLRHWSTPAATTGTPADSKISASVYCRPCKIACVRVRVCVCECLFEWKLELTSLFNQIFSA